MPKTAEGVDEEWCRGGAGPQRDDDAAKGIQIACQACGDRDSRSIREDEPRKQEDDQLHLFGGIICYAVPPAASIEFGNLDANVRFLEGSGLLRPGLRVLEIGCGTGTLLQRLHARGLDIVGVETSAARIEESRRTYDALPIHQISGAALPFPSEHFDIVLSFDVFEHIPDSDAHLTEVSRVLKPGGGTCSRRPTSGRIRFSKPSGGAASRNGRWITVRSTATRSFAGDWPAGVSRWLLPM